MGKRKIKYKGISVNLIGLPISENYKKENKYVKRNYLKSFSPNLKQDCQRDLLLIYDIPDTMKKERDWFRRQLVSFDFILIQKSVWVGPSPLPKYFVDYLKEISLENKFKIFKLGKPYTKD